MVLANATSLNVLIVFSPCKCNKSVYCSNQDIIIGEKKDPMTFHNYATVHMFGIGKIYLNVFERTPNYPKFLKGRVKSIFVLAWVWFVLSNHLTMPF